MELLLFLCFFFVCFLLRALLVFQLCFTFIFIFFSCCVWVGDSLLKSDVSRDQGESFCSSTSGFGLRSLPFNLKADSHSFYCSLCTVHLYCIRFIKHVTNTSRVPLLTGFTSMLMLQEVAPKVPPCSTVRLGYLEFADIFVIWWEMKEEWSLQQTHKDLWSGLGVILPSSLVWYCVQTVLLSISPSLSRCVILQTVLWCDVWTSNYF